MPREGAKLRRVNIRRRIITLFVAGVAVPSGLLGYLALRGVRNDQALFERELRERLEGEAAEVLASFETRLSALLAGLASSDSMVPNERLVDAVFSLTPEGSFGNLVTSDALFEPVGGAWSASSPEFSESDARELDRARQLELRDNELADASLAYAHLLAGGDTDRGRAEALSGLARVSRRRRNAGAAADHYRRLITEFGPLPSGAGIPFGLVGRLELIALLTETDWEAAVAEVTSLLQALLSGEHDLTATEYGFVADGARRSARELDALGTGVSGGRTDSVHTLLDREDVERRRSARIRAFVSVATEDPALLAGLTRSGDGDRPRSAMIQGEGGPFPVRLVVRQSADVDRDLELVGVLLDPVALDEVVTEVVRDAADAGGFDWVLQRETGSMAATNTGDPTGLPMVLASFPGRFPPLTLGLMPPTTGAVESFFSSPQSLYLYAFLLVAGILAGGLALTVRTLTHQLELGRMQSDFVSTVSHELKSPLTAIRQLAEMLQAGRVPSEERRQEYFDVLVEQSERLTGLIDHVLDFSRIDAGHAELDFAAVDLKHLLEEVVARVQERVRHQGFLVHGVFDSVLPPVTLDPEAIALATTSVIDNGIKFSGDSREVIVRTDVEGGHAIIAVQDFGIGLDRSERERVFERFYRGGEALTRSVKGTGLGLTLVKQIVESHGGSVEVDSEPGCGSIFTIRLPVAGP